MGQNSRAVYSETHLVYHVRVGDWRKTYIHKRSALIAYAKRRVADKIKCTCDAGDHVTPGEYCGHEEARDRVLRKFQKVVLALNKGRKEAI